MLKDFIGEKWRVALSKEVEKEYFVKIENALEKEKTFLPERESIFEFTKALGVEDIKVVIIGQDPYFRKEQASGLAFSSPIEFKGIPSCCRTLFLGVKYDYPEFKFPKLGNLLQWVDQGVLLLNDTLTVREQRPGSHFKMNWSQFTNRVVEIISEQRENIPFLLCGTRARSKKQFIDTGKHFVLETVHPSHHHARKFISAQNFIKINRYLDKKGLSEIQW